MYRSSRTTWTAASLWLCTLSVSLNGNLVVAWDVLVSISASSGFPNRGNDFLKVFYFSQIYSPCYYLVAFSDANGGDVDSAKLIGGGRPPKKRGVGRPTSSGSERSQRNRKEYMKDYKASQNSISATGSDCNSSVFDMDESESNAPSSESGLSTQDSKSSSRGRGRQKKQKRGPVPRKKQLGK